MNMFSSYLDPSIEDVFLGNDALQLVILVEFIVRGTTHFSE